MGFFPKDPFDGDNKRSPQLPRRLSLGGGRACLFFLPLLLLSFFFFLLKLCSLVLGIMSTVEIKAVGESAVFHFTVFSWIGSEPFAKRSMTKRRDLGCLSHNAPS